MSTSAGRHPKPALAAGILVLLASLMICAPAFGDADPASDILLGENVFYPYSPPVSGRLQAALNAEVAAVHKHRLPLKVALIGSPIDLGALPTFFGKPQQYAAFLAQEITFGKGKAPLLVVMPSGYGAAGLPAAAQALVASLGKPKAPGADGLAEAAITAVPRIAAAAGHPVGRSAGNPIGTGGSDSSLLLAVLAGVCVILAAAIIAWRRRTATAPARKRAPRRRR